MVRIPISSKNAKGRSVPLTAETLVNMYAEEAPGGSKSPFIVHGSPGVRYLGWDSTDEDAGTGDLEDDLLLDPNGLYMTRYEGNNTNLFNNGITAQEIGTDNLPFQYINSDGGYYSIACTSESDTDYNKIDCSSGLSFGDDFVIECLIDAVSPGNYSLSPFMAYVVSGSNAHEWGWHGTTPWVKFDTDVGGDQYASFPTGSSGKEHFAIQFEYISGTDYRTRAYWKGVQRYTETLAHVNNSTFGVNFRIGKYSTDTQTTKIYEVAIRKENKYPDGTTFTPPTTLDGPYL